MESVKEGEIRTSLGHPRWSLPLYEPISRLRIRVHLLWVILGGSLVAWFYPHYSKQLHGDRSLRKGFRLGIHQIPLAFDFLERKLMNIA